MKSLGFIIKPFLNIVAWCLKLSRHNIYYLVTGPLKKEIAEVSEYAFASQHIYNAIEISNSMQKFKGDCILDIGGGQATTAQIFSEKYPNHAIHIFEPILSNFKFIESSKYRTANWKIHNKAAGSKTEEKIIQIADRITASSLLELNADKIGGDYGKALKKVDTQTISVTTIDDEIAPTSLVDIMKLDVQGYELEVLKGATQTLKNTKVIVFEVNNHSGFKNAPTYFELDEFLRNRNFELFDILPNKRQNLKLLDWDTIYVNKSLL